MLDGELVNSSSANVELSLLLIVDEEKGRHLILIFLCLLEGDNNGIMRGGAIVKESRLIGVGGRDSVSLTVLLLVL